MDIFTTTAKCNTICWNTFKELLFRAADYGKRYRQSYTERSLIMGIGKKRRQINAELRVEQTINYN